MTKNKNKLSRARRVTKTKFIIRRIANKNPRNLRRFFDFYQRLKRTALSVFLLLAFLGGIFFSSQRMEPENLQTSILSEIEWIGAELDDIVDSSNTMKLAGDTVARKLKEFADWSSRGAAVIFKNRTKVNRIVNLEEDKSEWYEKWGESQLALASMEDEQEKCTSKNCVLDLKDKIARERRTAEAIQIEIKDLDNGLSEIYAEKNEENEELFNDLLKETGTNTAKHFEEYLDNIQDYDEKTLNFVAELVAENINLELAMNNRMRLYDNFNLYDCDLDKKYSQQACELIVERKKARLTAEINRILDDQSLVNRLKTRIESDTKNRFQSLEKMLAKCDNFGSDNFTVCERIAKSLRTIENSENKNLTKKVTLLIAVAKDIYKNLSEMEESVKQSHKKYKDEDNDIKESCNSKTGRERNLCDSELSNFENEIFNIANRNNTLVDALRSEYDSFHQEILNLKKELQDKWNSSCGSGGILPNAKTDADAGDADAGDADAGDADAEDADAEDADAEDADILINKEIATLKKQYPNRFGNKDKSKKYFSKINGLIFECEYYPKYVAKNCNEKNIHNINQEIYKYLAAKYYYEEKEQGNIKEKVIKDIDENTYKHDLTQQTIILINNKDYKTYTFTLAEIEAEISENIKIEAMFNERMKRQIATFKKEYITRLIDENQGKKYLSKIKEIRNGCVGRDMDTNENCNKNAIHNINQEIYKYFSAKYYYKEKKLYNIKEKSTKDTNGNTYTYYYKEKKQEQIKQIVTKDIEGSNIYKHDLKQKTVTLINNIYDTSRYDTKGTYTFSLEEIEVEISETIKKETELEAEISESIKKEIASDKRLYSNRFSDKNEKSEYLLSMSKWLRTCTYKANCNEKNIHNIKQEIYKYFAAKYYYEEKEQGKIKEIVTKDIGGNIYKHDLKQKTVTLINNGTTYTFSLKEIEAEIKNK
jgi:hypothetical protein